MSENKITLTYIISELKIGGAEKLLESIILKLDDDKFKVNLIVLGEKEENLLYSNLINKGIDIFYCNKNGKDIIKCSRKIRKILSITNTDIVHIHTSILHLCIWGLIINNVKGRFYTIHSIPEFDSPGFKRYLYSIFFNFFKVKGIAISKTIEDMSKKYFKTSNIITIENGIDIEKFKSNISIENRKSNRILHVGRFVDVKNQKLLIKAIKELENFDFNVTFVGDGETLEDNKKLARELGVEKKIEFLGKRSDINTIMDKNSIFVLCSKIEGAPISIIEAMANGMAIISADVGGVSDFIENEKEGILIEVNSKDKLVEAIKNLLNDNEKIYMLSRNAINKSEEYSMKNCIKKHIKLYKDILMES